MVWPTRGRGGGGGSGVTVVATTAAALARATRQGQIFFVEADQTYYGTEDYEVTAEIPAVPAGAGSITSRDMVAADFRSPRSYSLVSYVVNYHGSVSSTPAAPSAGEAELFWDNTANNGLGPTEIRLTDKPRLKVRLGASTYESVLFQGSILALSATLRFIGDDIYNFNAFGAATDDTDAEVAAVIDGEPDLQERLTFITPSVVYATQNNPKLVLTYTAGAPAVPAIPAVIGIRLQPLVSAPVGSGQTAAQVNALIAAAGHQTATEVQTLIDAAGHQSAAQVQALIDAGGYQDSAEVLALISASSHVSNVQYSTINEELTVTRSDGVSYPLDLSGLSGGGGGGASSFSDLTGMIADGQIPSGITRDSEVENVYSSISINLQTQRMNLTTLGGSNFSLELPGGLSEMEVDARITLLAALLAGATFTGAVKGLTPVDNTDFATKAYVDSLVSGGSVIDDIYWGTSVDETPEGSELTIEAENGAAVITGYSGDMHILVARLAAESDFTRLVRSDDDSQTNQLGAFTKFASTVIPSGETMAYNVWVSNQALSQTADVTWTAS